MTPEAKAIFEQIKAMTPPDRLRLAAELMDRGRGDTAYFIAKGTVDGLGAALALRALDTREGAMP